MGHVFQQLVWPHFVLFFVTTISGPYLCDFLWGWWSGTQGHSSRRFNVGSASLKKFQISSLIKHRLILVRHPTSLYRSAVYMLILICMRYLCVSEIHQTVTQTTGSLTCLHDLLIYAYMHTCSVCLYLFCKTEWLSFSKGGGGGLGFPFIKS